jgi:hypothetical protein
MIVMVSNIIIVFIVTAVTLVTKVSYAAMVAIVAMLTRMSEKCLSLRTFSKLSVFTLTERRSKLTERKYRKLSTNALVQLVFVIIIQIMLVRSRCCLTAPSVAA